MARINCYSNRCGKNKQGYCTANYINVLGENAHSTSETICSNFESESVFKSAISSMNFFSGSVGINGNTEIYCNASNCFYNGNGVCSAKNLQFKPNGVNDNSSCTTFIEAY